MTEIWKSVKSEEIEFESLRIRSAIYLFVECDSYSNFKTLQKSLRLYHGPKRIKFTDMQSAPHERQNFEGKTDKKQKKRNSALPKSQKNSKTSFT